MASRLNVIANTSQVFVGVFEVSDAEVPVSLMHAIVLSAFNFGTSCLS